MRKSVWIFLLAVLVPSAVLGWLALRSAEEQQIILERRTVELYQRETENLAAAARAIIDEQRRAFAESVRTLLAEAKPEIVAQDFAARLPGAWPRKAVGFSLAARGHILSPATARVRSASGWIIPESSGKNRLRSGRAVSSVTRPPPVACSSPPTLSGRR